MTTLANARVVTPKGVIDPGWVAFEGELITGTGAGPPPDGPVVDLSGSWILPGFVDVHVHGGGGHSIVGGDPDAAAQAIAFHRSYGTTSMALSLVTAPMGELVEEISQLSGLVRADRRQDGSAGVAATIHLEGPFLHTARCGAQDPGAMIEPDPRLVDRLIAAGRGTVGMVTIAPELDGALAAVAQLADSGVVVALGHTTATLNQAVVAFAAGATVATHLFNAMTPMHHRSPGTAGAALDDSEVVCELILDGFHIHPAMARLAMAVKGPSRIALVTDAIALAGVGDGTGELAGRPIVVENGEARLADTGALAGSTLTMDRALRAAVALGMPIESASEMASATPARILGLAATRGFIEVGKHADLVVLDDDLAVQTVITAGVM